MSTINNQQQHEAIILKGIAQQLLQMNVPSYEQLKKMLNIFDYDLIDKDALSTLIKNEDKANKADDTYSRMYRAVQIALSFDPSDREDIESMLGSIENTTNNIVHHIIHHALKAENETVSAIKRSMYS